MVQNLYVLLVNVLMNLHELQMNSLPMLLTLAPQGRVSLLLMSQLVQLASDWPALMSRMLKQIGVLFVNSYSPHLVLLSASVVWSCLRKPYTKRQLQVLILSFTIFKEFVTIFSWVTTRHLIYTLLWIYLWKAFS